MSEVQRLRQVAFTNSIRISQIRYRPRDPRDAVEAPCRKPEAVDRMTQEPQAAGVGPGDLAQLGRGQEGIEMLAVGR